MGEGRTCSYDFPINQMFSLTLTSLKYFLLREGKKGNRTSFGCQFLFSQHTTSTHPHNRGLRIRVCGYLCICSSFDKLHMWYKSNLALQLTMCSSPFPHNSLSIAIAVLMHCPSHSGVKQQFRHFAGFVGYQFGQDSGETTTWAQLEWSPRILPLQHGSFRAVRFP